MQGAFGLVVHVALTQVAEHTTSNLSEISPELSQSAVRGVELGSKLVGLH